MHFTTTPNNRDEKKAGAWSYKFINEQCLFRYSFYDMTDEELKTFIRKNSKNNFVYIRYTWQEIGRSQQWYDEMCQQMSSLSKIKRELDLVWTSSIENGVFSEEELEPINKHVNPVIYTLNVKDYGIDFYERPNFLEKYILSCDVSGGTEKDNSVITFIDPRDFHVVADFTNSKIDTDSFKNLIESLMDLYFPNSILVIERNSFGKNILDYLMKKPKIEPRMYREYRERTAERVTVDGINVKGKRKTLIYGVDTTSSSRKQMFDLLPNIVKTEFMSIRSPKLRDDIANLVELPNGRIEAAQGMHDDNLMSYLIFRWAVYYSDFFKNRYGIAHIPSNGDGMFSESGSESALRLTNKIKNIEMRDNLSVSKQPFIQTLMQEEKRVKEETENKPRDRILTKIINWNS